MKNYIFMMVLISLASCSSFPSRKVASIPGKQPDKGRVWGLKACGFRDPKMILDTNLFDLGAGANFEIKNGISSIYGLTKSQIRTYSKEIRETKFVGNGRWNYPRQEIYRALLGAYENDLGLKSDTATTWDVVHNSNYEHLESVSEITTEKGDLLFYFQMDIGDTRSGIIVDLDGRFIGGNSDGDFFCYKDTQP